MKNLELSALVNLQSIDTRIYELKGLINEIPEQVEQQNKTLSVFEDKLKKVQEEISNAEKAQKDFGEAFQSVISNADILIKR